MNMLCFKFHQNHVINEEFDFWGAKFILGAPREPGGAEFQKFEKDPYRMVLQTYNKNFSTLAQLESV